MSEQAPLLIGCSAAIRAVEIEIGYAARSDAKVLLTGESGVGKEVIARLIHARSGRARTPLVAVNCAGIPESLLESTLFGHVKGSFTDAHRDRLGLLEVADRGTIFLDEIGEMSLRMQALLLRFMECGEIQRVGADRAQSRVDVRVIAATNRDLLERIASKAFRDDLYYRLKVVHITIPALRARSEDIPEFLRYFLQQYAEQHGVKPPELTADALAHLVAYDWPGNVRELKNVVERLIVRQSTGRVVLSDLPAEIQRPLHAAATTGSARADEIFERIVFHGESFWTAAQEPFMARDLTRNHLRAIVHRGLGRTGGSYKLLIPLFNMPPDNYRRFLNFLRKHECYLRVPRPRGAEPEESSRHLSDDHGTRSSNPRYR